MASSYTHNRRQRVASGRQHSARTASQARRRNQARRRRQLESTVARLNPHTRLQNGLDRIALPPLHLAGFSGWQPSKVVSLLLLLAACGVLYTTLTADRFFIYREDVHFTKLQYLESDELYGAAQVEGWSVFWLQPNGIRQSLRRHPYITDAQVRVGLPGHLIIEVTEAQPAALWVTDEQNWWLLADGTALPMRYADPGTLLQIFDGARNAQHIHPDPQLAIDPAIMQSALRLQERFPELRQLHYNTGHGLNFSYPGRDTWVYWGDGHHIDKKLTNLTAILQVLQSEGLGTPVIDLRYPNRPYFQ